MSLVAGASRYVTQSTYTNATGESSSSTDLVSSISDSLSLLNVGKNLAVSGIGISDSARSLNLSFLENSSNTYNTLFSANATSSDDDALETQILALRSTTPTHFNTDSSETTVDETV